MDGYRYGCNRARSKGTCANTLKVKRVWLEEQVARVIRHQMMAPDWSARAIAEIKEALANRSDNADAERAVLTSRLRAVDNRIANILRAIEDGFYTPELKARRVDLDRERTAIMNDLTDLGQPADVALPDDETIRRGLNTLLENVMVLADPDDVPHGLHHALRQAIEKIVLTPDADGTVSVL